MTSKLPSSRAKRNKGDAKHLLSKFADSEREDISYLYPYNSLRVKPLQCAPRDRCQSALGANGVSEALGPPKVKVNG